MKTYTVYKHTTPNNKVYIGITSQNPIKRWKGGDGYRNNKHFYRAILKYGWDNINHEILFSDLEKREALEKEVELIDFYKANNPKFGYNQTKGGDYRKPLSDYSKWLVSIHNKGKRRTEEQKRHYVEGAKKRPKRETLSEEHRKKISESLKGNKRATGLETNQRPIIQFSLDWEIVCVYKCAREASEILGCSSSGLNKACKENTLNFTGTSKYGGIYKGYRWLYFENFFLHREMG